MKDVIVKSATKQQTYLWLLGIFVFSYSLPPVTEICKVKAADWLLCTPHTFVALTATAMIMHVTPLVVH